MNLGLNPFSTRGATFNVVVWGFVLAGAAFFAATGQPQLWPLVVGFAALEVVFVVVLLIARRKGRSSPLRPGSGGGS